MRWTAHCNENLTEASSGWDCVQPVLVVMRDAASERVVPEDFSADDSADDALAQHDKGPA